MIDRCAYLDATIEDVHEVLVVDYSVQANK